LKNKKGYEEKNILFIIIRLYFIIKVKIINERKYFINKVNWVKKKKFFFTNKKENYKA
jgi:hypothetical protein